MIKTFDRIEVPALGFGTWQLRNKACRNAIIHALELGYRHIDTAQAYDNEQDVGMALEEAGISRDEVFLTTKIQPDRLSGDQVLKSFEKSLEKLKTDYTDLLLIHWPSTDGIPLEETLEAMKLLKADGKTRSIGVSNFSPKLIEEALSIANILCNQVEYHPFLRQQKLLELSNKHDLMLTAYSPLAKGKIADNPTLQKIAQKYNKTPAQITLRWLVQQENVVTIPKAANPEHRASNFNIFDFNLTEDEMNMIFALENGKRLIDPDFAPNWDE
ncbi:oxidoreductase aldo/keto reductase family [Fulvivirga imtechensis AK7]|uniref:Oxidoreductase aldo/keto reductase family n=1 Tax=Fulvivirga imtechensis AK7 TaxID=1237149 RepID=L8JY12_9BACT|nr:aldo/keto reductase [Fulvivirga imtechensis]ELR73063.1 oxidoreductase aldo/keto reductase family [Fulvivirga imtechensis AK7]